MKFLSDSFKKGIKRQLILKALDIIIDALIDFKQTYQTRTNVSNETNVPVNNLNNHL